MPPRLSLLLEPDRSRVARRRDRHCDLGSGICEAVHLSGGEPAARRDIVEITAAAHRASLYTNLITSAVGLTEKKLAALAEARLDHVRSRSRMPTPPRRTGECAYAGKRALVSEVVRRDGPS
jgi:pyruvate formate-lyase activating enzyme-like uncharacterized protein